MVSRKARLQYIPYGLIVLGLIAVWYGYVEQFSFLVIGVAAILGAVYALVRGYTATNLAVMFGAIALSGLLGIIIHLVVQGVTQPSWLLAYILLSIAGGVRARQYWQARLWTLGESNW